MRLPFKQDQQIGKEEKKQKTQLQYDHMLSQLDAFVGKHTL